MMQELKHAQERVLAMTGEVITSTIPHFCRLTGVGRSKTYELLKNGDLASIKIGRRRLVVMASYYQFVERHRDGGGSK